jgi:catechol 2,3-dioxygenase-like lactoylglutathione lyase family enzyme
MILHADLFVSSMARSLDFYVDGLGFAVADDAILRGDLPSFLSQGHFEAMRLVLLKPAIIAPMIELIEFQADSAKINGANGNSPFQPPPHHGSIAIVVKNLGTHVSALEAKDIRPSSDVYEVTMPKVGNSKVIFYRDPDGHLLEFLQILNTGGSIVN